MEPYEPIAVSPELLERVLALYDRGLYVQAYRVSREAGPLKHWSGTAARLLAGRLAGNIGAVRLGRVLHRLAWRTGAPDPEAAYFHARYVLERRGPAAAWAFLNSGPHIEPWQASHRAWELEAFRAHVLALLRDFERARQALVRAEAAGGDKPWFWVEKASVLEEQDRYTDALEAARHAFTIRAWYRPAVQAVGHLLQLLERDDEAVDFLNQAGARLESGAVWALLSAIHSEAGRWSAVREALDRCAECSPLMEKDFAAWLAARRSDAAYHTGDYPAAIEFAKAAGDPYHVKLAERLAALPADGGRRVLLPVGFVRQHHATCAPATLSAVSRYWGRPAEHLEIAEKICYDGTPAHSERRWATTHGWIAREFTVTWEAASALIDRGIPFTLTTVEPGNAHLQAVIGYDTRQGTLLVRDPYHRHYGEWFAEESLKHYAACGPRGMAMIPADRPGAGEGLTLPDAELYDDLYELNESLERHDRAAARKAYDRMVMRDPGHRLTLEARRTLAIYDGDQSNMLVAYERLLALYPDDVNFQLGRLACLRDLDRAETRRQALAEAAGKKGADALLVRAHIEEIAADARRHDEASELLERLESIRGRDPHVLRLRADLLWTQHRRAEALELYRFAACTADKDERLSRTYFSAARVLGRTDEALAFLQNRCRQLSGLSGRPAGTLFWALAECERTPEGLAALEEVMARRPDDGELMLSAADSFARLGRFERAEALLTAAAGKVPESQRLRTAAELAAFRGDLIRAEKTWRTIAESEPQAPDVQRSLTQVIAELNGRAAALEHLRGLTERFPHSYPLHQLRIEWLRDEGAGAVEPVVRRLVEIDPIDAWARRELAGVLGDLRRFEEAFTEAEIGVDLDPGAPAAYCVRGRLHEQNGNLEAACADYRQAVRLSVDTEYAIARLIGCAADIGARRRELRFVLEELERQTIFGGGLLTWRQFASGTFEPAELLRIVREGWAARPDLWQTWSALVQQLLEADDAVEALQVAAAAAERFPLLPAVWVDLAAAQRRCGDRQGEIEALHKALQINPSWGAAGRRLADVYDRACEYDKAREILEQAAARTPLDPYNHGALADILWKLDRKDEALERLRRAIRLDPGYDWAWDMLRAWSEKLKRPNEAAETARDLTLRRPTEPRAWLLLAQMLDADKLDERLAALDRAVALNPRFEDAYDVRASLLAAAKRFDEALAACRPTVFGSALPYRLRGRAAWVEAMRGDLPKAVELMRTVLGEEPDYYWGRFNVCEWLREIGPASEYLAAAEHMVRLTPENPRAWGMLGEAKIRCGQRAAGKQAYEKAMSLAGDYPFAVLSLFDEQLADGELDAAAATLAAARDRLLDDRPYVTARQVQLAAKRSDRAWAEQGLSELATAPATDRWPLSAAIDAAVGAGWLDAVEKALAPLTDGDAGPARSKAGAEASTDRTEPKGDGVGPPPGYHGVVRLAEHYRDVGRLEDYRRLAERLTVLAPADPTAYGTRAEARQRLGDRDGARADYRKALALAADYSWAANALFDLEMEDGRVDEAGEVIAEARKWSSSEYVIARQIQWAAAVDDRAAAEKAFAELCAAESREPWPFGAAAEAFIRAGWAEAAEDIARAEADKCLARRPAGDQGPSDHRLLPALGELMDLRRSEGDWPAMASLAELGIRLAPAHAPMRGYLADARLAAGERDAGISALEEALRLDPKYEFAADRLVDLYVAEGRFGEADRVVQMVGDSQGAERRAVLRMQAAAEGTEAQAALAELCRLPEAQEQSYEGALEAFGRLDRLDLFEETLGAALQLPEARPVHGRFLVKCLAQQGLLHAAGKMTGTLLGRGEFGGPAAVEYAAALGRAGARLRLWWFLRRYGDRLRRSTTVWGEIGYALNLGGLHRTACRHLADWRSRRDARPWMLVNLADSLRSLGRDGAAAEVSRAALHLEPDHGCNKHHAWLALDEAIDGSPEAAQRELAEVRHDTDDKAAKFLKMIAEATLTARQAEAGGQREDFGRVRLLLHRAQAVAPDYRRHAELRRALRRAKKAIAKARGGFFSWLWTRL